MMLTKSDLQNVPARHPDTVMRTRETIRRWIVRGKIARRKRQVAEHLSPRLRRDVGLDRPAA